MTDIDRMLRDAMRVEPGGDFAARIRTRVAASPRQSRGLVPRFAFAALACAVLALVSTSISREADRTPPESVLPHRDLIVLAQPARVVSSPPPPQLAPRRSRRSVHATTVVVSRSEMLALQRLFAGLTVAPPSLPAPAEELSIPKLAIAPVLTGGTEGERQ